MVLGEKEDSTPYIRCVVKRADDTVSETTRLRKLARCIDDDSDQRIRRILLNAMHEGDLYFVSIHVAPVVWNGTFIFMVVPYCDALGESFLRDFAIMEARRFEFGGVDREGPLRIKLVLFPSYVIPESQWEEIEIGGASVPRSERQRPD